jgi:hypothetical protein
MFTTPRVLSRSNWIIFLTAFELFPTGDEAAPAVCPVLAGA